ncbi:lipopolysaccharide export system permease protein [Pontibacter ummariensis]|uniref:Lipopolysaccharide export system permease protein n=1 Tax=Pontibacter ummariensis TaxID=1610492 RepID=A0A239BYU5_9BACT|nr:LptF/LptG family permease [Pontibacter ummariensis]PRY15534.1 lipopolysaccharide export system permease protein [Pontibacter ummariensis]SNS13235.1 lipopolysaccharide export system permease protein [Pontibacter ummariensis]
MKKLDKLILRAFLGPFLLTFAVVEFILLTQYMLKYLDELVGKDLGAEVFAELLFYFSMNMAPVALPLAVLLSALMTFGTLGEHHELTAIKTAGIPLTRILRPVFIAVSLLTIGAFFFNNNIVPKANLKAYSLLWDIRQKKPAMNFKEGAFYNGIPGYSIKVNEKLNDGQTLRDVMIYDHSKGGANTTVILADSGEMYMAYDDNYLILELFRGNTYIDQNDASFRNTNDQFARQRFDESKIVLSMASFNLDRTREELFSDNKMMKNISQLKVVTDSLRRYTDREETRYAPNVDPFYMYFKADTGSVKNGLRLTGKALERELPKPTPEVLAMATNKARNIKSFTASYVERLNNTLRDANNYEIEIWKKYTQSAAIIIMFLIGAPLGAIIKKGGLGVPVLISIMFFIFMYVMSILGEKWAREGIVPVGAGLWAANMVLLPIGLFFLYQARSDSSLLEVDFWRKLVTRLRRNKL